MHQVNPPHCRAFSSQAPAPTHKVGENCSITPEKSTEFGKGTSEGLKAETNPRNPRGFVNKSVDTSLQAPARRAFSVSQTSQRKETTEAAKQMHTLPGALLGTAPPGGGSCGAQEGGCTAPAARLLGSDAHTVSNAE